MASLTRMHTPTTAMRSILTSRNCSVHARRTISWKRQIFATASSGDPLIKRATAETTSATDTSTSSSVAQAFQDGTLGVGFSAGGLLFPYYVGVLNKLKTTGVMRDDTPVAGASAGSLIAACSKAGLSHEELVEATLQLADECRRVGTRHNLGPVLRKTLDRMLPDDIHERAMAGNVQVAVTKVIPRITPTLLTKYESRQDLIEALLTSCHIPWYFDSSLVRPFRGSLHCDGGLTNFLPKPSGTTRTVRVCCFPSERMKAAFGDICITPDNYDTWPYDMRTMLNWAFNPADDDMLLYLVEKGEKDASSWLESQPELQSVLQQQQQQSADVRV